MKKTFLFLIALLGVFLQSNGQKQVDSCNDNAVSLGKINVGVKILVLANPDTGINNAFDVDSLLNEFEIYGATVPIFGNRDTEQMHLLKKERSLFYGEVPVERLQEIGGIRIYKNGEFQGGTQFIFRQGEPAEIALWMSEDGSILSVDYREMDLSKWLNVSEISANSVSANPFMFMPPNEMYNSWKDVRAYQIDSIWPRYLKESIGTNSVPEEVADWLMNNLKITFATYCILPYVRNAKEISGIAVEEPPMEAYAFLDSIDYSPDVFLKTNMLISPRNLLQQILKYPCGGMEPIGEMPVDRWQDMVSRKLQPAMKERPKLLLDLLAGMSYIQQIEENHPLTDKQKRNIDEGFTNDIGKIVLAKNNRMLAMKNDSVSLHDISGESFALQKYIDENYAGRPVVVDMWNTWCAPCLNAIYQTEEIKHSFANTDLVFLYISDESSGLEEWKRRAKHIGGEQVRISEDASEALQNSYNLTGFPSYLFFDSNHRLVHAQTAFPGINRYTELLNKISR